MDRQALSSLAPSGGDCHVFCDVPLSLLPPSPRSEGSEGSVSDGVEQRLHFGGMIPELQEGLVLPSFELDGPGGERWAHIVVKWCIKLRGARKGLFKSDDKCVRRVSIKGEVLSDCHSPG